MSRIISILVIFLVTDLALGQTVNFEFVSYVCRPSRAEQLDPETPTKISSRPSLVNMSGEFRILYSRVYDEPLIGFAEYRGLPTDYKQSFLFYGSFFEPNGEGEFTKNRVDIHQMKYVGEKDILTYRNQGAVSLDSRFRMVGQMLGESKEGLRRAHNKGFQIYSSILTTGGEPEFGRNIQFASLIKVSPDFAKVDSAPDTFNTDVRFFNAMEATEGLPKIFRLRMLCKLDQSFKDDQILEILSKSNTFNLGVTPANDDEPPVEETGRTFGSSLMQNDPTFNDAVEYLRDFFAEKNVRYYELDWRSWTGLAAIVGYVAYRALDMRLGGRKALSFVVPPEMIKTSVGWEGYRVWSIPEMEFDEFKKWIVSGILEDSISPSLRQWTIELAESLRRQRARQYLESCPKSEFCS